MEIDDGDGDGDGATERSGTVDNGDAWRYLTLNEDENLRECRCLLLFGSDNC